MEASNGIPFAITRRSPESATAYWNEKLAEAEQLGREAEEQMRTAGACIAEANRLIAKRTDIVRAYQLQKLAEQGQQ